MDLSKVGVLVVPHFSFINPIKVLNKKREKTKEKKIINIKIRYIYIYQKTKRENVKRKN